MSPSTFRQHFRALTGVSPLQYQKQLRLQEARQLMLNENLDAGSAGGRVGYESPSQFSREYSRLFGAPPQRDVTRMRLAPVATASPRRGSEVRSSWNRSTPSIDPTVAGVPMKTRLPGLQRTDTVHRVLMLQASPQCATPAILESARRGRVVAVSDRERLRGLSQSLSQFGFAGSATSL